MRRYLPVFRKVVTDCIATVTDDRRVLGTLQSKYETIYTRCELTSLADRQPGITHRLLWASRICPQKRPELLTGIAKALSDLGLNVVIDAYGTPDPGVDPIDIFGGRSVGIEYRGPFSAFQEIPIESYDAFLYTSGYDGLPNILLEVLAAGLPVVAPDVGGIGEVVKSGVTGWLVEADDEHALVQGYAHAISALYENPDSAERMATNGRLLIANQHGSSAFSARVGEVLGLYETTITAVGEAP
jgi:glycosyltransferase involved in cell wall biosynthesis